MYEKNQLLSIPQEKLTDYIEDLIISEINEIQTLKNNLKYHLVELESEELFSKAESIEDLIEDLEQIEEVFLPSTKETTISLINDCLFSLFIVYYLAAVDHRVFDPEANEEDAGIVRDLAEMFNKEHEDIFSQEEIEENGKEVLNFSRLSTDEYEFKIYNKIIELRTELIIRFLEKQNDINIIKADVYNSVKNLKKEIEKLGKMIADENQEDLNPMFHQYRSVAIDINVTYNILNDYLEKNVDGELFIFKEFLEKLTPLVNDEWGILYVMYHAININESEIRKIEHNAYESQEAGEQVQESILECLNVLSELRIENWLENTGKGRTLESLYEESNLTRDGLLSFDDILTLLDIPINKLSEEKFDVVSNLFEAISNFSYSNKDLTSLN